jgi:hypothetical protein
MRRPAARLATATVAPEYLFPAVSREHFKSFQRRLCSSLEWISYLVVLHSSRRPALSLGYFDCRAINTGGLLRRDASLG